MPSKVKNLSKKKFKKTKQNKIIKKKGRNKKNGIEEDIQNFNVTELIQLRRNCAA